MTSSPGAQLFDWLFELLANEGGAAVRADVSIDAHGARAVPDAAVAARDRVAGAAPSDGLVLRCDANRCAAARRSGWQEPLLWIPGRPTGSGAVGDFLTALARGDARGVVVQAPRSTCAVFRGTLAGWALRLTIAAVGGRPDIAVARVAAGG